jgi:hypothetical protein
MFDESLSPDFDQGESPDDVSLDDWQQPEPLSWKLSDQYKKVGDTGWRNKFNIRMAVQVGLSIFYAIVYGLSFRGLKPYYEWPLDDLSSSTSLSQSLPVDFSSVLTDEEYFVCQDKEYFLNQTGPLLRLDDSYDIVYSNGTHLLLQNMGLCWGITIAFFVAFIVFRVWSGQYNVLLLVVKFKEDINESGRRVIKPVKLSFAYTIMCNAKSISNVVFQSLCDRMAFPSWKFVHSTFQPYGFDQSLNAIFLFLWGLMVLWISWYIVTCGRCCGLCTPEKGLESAATYLVLFRLLVVCNTVIMLLTWIVNFDLSIQFSLNYPVLCVTNVISWIDLAVSFIGDVCLKFPNCSCCSKSMEESSDVHQETITGDARA